MPKPKHPYDASNRSEILGKAVLPFLRDGDAVLDVGCGYADHPRMQGTMLPMLVHVAYPKALYCGIDRRPEVIEECRKGYGHGEWTVGDAGRIVHERAYDAVFHLGFDRKDLSDAWLVHPNLLGAGKGPRVALLEAGTRRDMVSGHVQSFAEVKALYEKRGYRVVAKGEYVWTYMVTQRFRRYAVMERA